MKTSKLPSYQTLQQEITSNDPVSTPAELHGLLCGLVCTGGSEAQLPEYYQESAIMQYCFPLVTNQFSSALDQAFALELILPADDYPLSVRTQAIAEWAQGFMAGLGEGGFQWQQATDELQEILTDFQSIAQLRGGEFIKDEDVTEEDEKAFVDVYEYLRMAVLNIYTDLVIAENIQDEDPETLH